MNTKMNTAIQPKPLSQKGTIMMKINIAGFFLLWMIGLYAYFTITEQIPFFFDGDGNPISYRDNVSFLIAALTFSLVPAFFIIVTKYRYTLVNKYPNVIKLKPFFILMEKISPENRGYWVNGYFEIILQIGTVLTLYILVLAVLLFQGTLIQTSPSWISSFSIAVPIVLLIHTIWAVRNFFNKMNAETEVE